jgi:tryptophan synthase alpha chain
MTRPAEIASGRNRLEAIFSDLRRGGRAALMPFVTGGYPSLAATAASLPELERAGASVVEIGIPFSDPIADGPLIAAAMHEALAAGTTPDDVLDLVRAVRSRTSLGLVAMVSHSIVERLSTGRFLARAADAGFDGLIVPDIDLEEAPALRDAADQAGLGLTLLVAPTTPPPRLKRITSLCSAFVYVLARAGITGERAEVPEIAARLEAVRAVTSLPVAVGFGISTPTHVAAVTAHADAAIVGSALVRTMGAAASGGPQVVATAAANLVRELARGLRGRPTR